MLHLDTVGITSGIYMYCSESKERKICVKLMPLCFQADDMTFSLAYRRSAFGSHYDQRTVLILLHAKVLETDQENERYIAICNGNRYSI